jgi:hypothetical protein
MTRDGTEKSQSFSWWLHNIDGLSNQPGIENVMYAGVTEVTQWDLLKVIYTRWHLKDASGKLVTSFHVAVSNTEWTLSTHEMRELFARSVNTELQKSLPSN